MLPTVPPAACGSAASTAAPCDVVVLGEALADLFPGGPVLGGAPFNVARHCAALGLKASIVTRVGRDSIGAAIVAECRRFGLPIDGVQHDPLLASGSATVTLHDGAHRFHIGPDQAWDAIDPEQAVAAVQRAAPALVCFGTLAQRAPRSRAAIHAALQATTARRVLDLNLRGSECEEILASESLRLAEIVKLNDDELAQVLAWASPSPLRTAPAWGTAAHEVAVAGWMRHFGLKLLVVTRGAAGCAAFDARAGRIVRAESPPVQVVDTVGAGDAFTAMLLVGLVRRWPLARTLREAAAFASSVCTLRGAVAGELGFYVSARAACTA